MPAERPSVVMPMRVAAAILMLPMLAALGQERVHVVREGDTLPRLVFLYGVDADAIQRANPTASQSLRPGQRLVIPGSGDAPVRAAEPVSERRAEPVARPPVPSPRVVDVEHSTPVARQPVPLETIPEHAKSPPTRLATRSTSGSAFASAIALPSSANIRYNGRWTPPGESSAWVMDCSNTARWLHRTVNGTELPRTASDQYEHLRTRRQLWRIRPDSRALRKKLQPGDLLFWENTYKPTRKPPITHVMVYLGTDAAGRMKMAGSQSSSGPDIYTFQPEQKMGGYRFFFFFRKEGRFVAYGRP